jgi:tRNA pseudouridine55 synthase
MNPRSDGLLLVDKEPGCTSHDVVQRARRILGLRKIGHCGTLDPTATGLLVLTLGKATRLTRFLINAPKVYSGTIRLGVATDTYDASGSVVEERPTAGVSQSVVEERMRAFEGTSDQVAPAYSAKKIGGVKYYELARRGEEVPTASKEVTIYDFHALGDLANDRIDFQLGCSSGTYVRTVAHDLGQQLGCGAHLESLRRLRVGPFELTAAATLDEIESSLGDESAAPKGWIAFDSIPLPFEDVRVDGQQESRISNGQTILVRDSDSGEGDWVKLVSDRGRLIAVGSVTEKIGTAGVVLVQPRIVFG